MASYTPNYNLKKPAGTDVVDIDDLNGNMDIIDTQLNSLNSKIANMTTKIVSVHMAGKTVGTAFNVDLPSGFTWSNTFIMSAMYRVWSTGYNALEKGSDVECVINISSSNQMSIKPVGQYSVNGDLYVLLCAQV